MAEGCGANCMKYTLFFFNLLFFLVGLGLVGIGAMLMIMMDSIKEAIKNDNPDIDTQWLLTLTAIVFMVVGFVLMGICFFGCCGAIKEIKCLLATYAALIILVILGELAVVIGMFVFKGKMQGWSEILNDGVRISFRSYTGDDDDANTDAVDRTQQNNQCCGADSYTDWLEKNKDWDRKSNYVVPVSCCKLLDDDIDENNLVDPKCPKRPTYDNSYIGKACVTSIFWPPILDNVFLIVIGAVVGLVAIEIIGVIFAICLIRNISEPRAVPV